MACTNFLSILVSIQKRKDEIKPLHVFVSVGTGVLPIKKVSAIDVYKPEGLFDLHNLYKSAMGAKNLGLLLVEAVSYIFTGYVS